MSTVALEPMREIHLRARYVVVVSASGLALLAALMLGGGLPERPRSSAMFWVFALFVLLGELLPIKVPRRGVEEEVTTSTTFLFALVLTWGVAPAVWVQAIASIVAALLSRKPAWKVAFNVARYTLSLTATAGCVVFLTNLQNLRGGSELTPSDLPVMLVSALVFFILNEVLVGIALALDQGIPVGEYLQRDFLFRISTSGALLALAPVLVVVAQETLWLIPLLVLPVAAVYRGASLENVRLVRTLKTSLDQLVDLNELNEHQALHDHLTDLPNRTLFRDRVEQALLRAQRDDSGGAVLLIDLDRFKEINDTLGHHHGDLLLRQIGPRLRRVLRESDTIARLGGDEFAALLPNVTEPPVVLQVAEKIQDVLSSPFELGGLTLDLQASIGIVLFPEHGRDVDALIRQADVAMYLAKEGRTRIEVYKPEKDSYSPERLALAGELRQAIAAKELVLYFQPKMDLKSGRPMGAESLLRWQHPQRGLMTPDQFIPLAERTGLIQPLSVHVIDTALRACHEWKKAGVKVSVAVNVSAWSLVELGLPDEVARLLAKWELEPHQLMLEITESTIMSDRQGSTEVLRKLHAMGVGLSIDDFGTGYSSLAYLRWLPVDEIKIDKSFVVNMINDESDAKIVRSTIDLGRNLGLRVVAEGVETEQVCQRLDELGCEVAQGHYLSRPLPPDRIIEWMVEHGARHVPQRLPRAEPRAASTALR